MRALSVDWRGTLDRVSAWLSEPSSKASLAVAVVSLGGVVGREVDPGVVDAWVTLLGCVLAVILAAIKHDPRDDGGRR